MFENCDVLPLQLIGGTATGVMVRFCGPLAALLLLAECSLRRRHALPENRKSVHSHPSNHRF